MVSITAGVSTSRRLGPVDGREAGPRKNSRGHTAGPVFVGLRLVVLSMSRSSALLGPFDLAFGSVSDQVPPVPQDVV